MGQTEQQHAVTLHCPIQTRQRRCQTRVSVPLALPGLFPNTKSDLGPCEFEIHEDHLDWEAIQAEYDALSAREKDRCAAKQLTKL